MFRLFDWQCARCGKAHESLVEFSQGSSAPRRVMLKCPRCVRVTSHVRMIPLPAKYMADRPLNPVVYGGRFDTAGHQAEPRLPEVPDGATYSDFKDLVHSKEYQGIKKEKARIRANNAAKKRRLKALKSGASVNMRVDRCPGDPKNITS